MPLQRITIQETNPRQDLILTLNTAASVRLKRDSRTRDQIQNPNKTQTQYHRAKQMITTEDKNLGKYHQEGTKSVSEKAKNPNLESLANPNPHCHSHKPATWWNITFKIHNIENNMRKIKEIKN